MKITGQNPPRTGELANTKAREGESRAPAEAGRKAGQAAESPMRASLTVSRVKDAIRNEPDVQAEKVAQLRERIRSGDYTVDSDRLAGNIINASLREDLERP